MHRLSLPYDLIRKFGTQFDSFIRGEPKFLRVCETPTTAPRAVEHPHFDTFLFRYLDGGQKVAIPRDENRLCNLTFTAEKGEIKAE